MYACLAVTCHLHFWQNDRDFLRATVVTRGWNGYRNKSQHRKSTLEKKILPPFQQGFGPATFQSRVRCSNHWAIPAPRCLHSVVRLNIGRPTVTLWTWHYLLSVTRDDTFWRLDIFTAQSLLLSLKGIGLLKKKRRRRRRKKKKKKRRKKKERKKEEKKKKEKKKQKKGRKKKGRKKKKEEKKKRKKKKEKKEEEKRKKKKKKKKKKEEEKRRRRKKRYYLSGRKGQINTGN